jgi:hypothetical protein
VAGRVKAERLVIAVSAAYYGDTSNGKRKSLQPLIDVIDRASPGIVELGTVQGGSGFAVSLAERPFPKQYEAELRRAAENYLGRGEARGQTGREAGEGGTAQRGIVARLVAAVRRMFSPSP